MARLAVGLRVRVKSSWGDVEAGSTGVVTDVLRQNGVRVHFDRDPQGRAIDEVEIAPAADLEVEVEE